MKKLLFLFIIINSVLLSQAVKTIDYKPSAEGFITSWMLRGTYAVDDTRTRDFDFLSDSGGEKNIWNLDKMLKSNLIGDIKDASSKWITVNNNFYNVSFQEYYGKSDFKACYALTIIDSKIDQKINIKCGSDDGIKLFLNGKNIHDNNAWRGVTPDEDNVYSELKKGLNSLLVKVNNGTGDFGFCLRITSRENTPLDNITLKFPNSYSDEDILKLISSSLSIYSTYDKTGTKAKFLVRISPEASTPSDFKKDLILKLSLADKNGNTIKEFYSETITNIGSFKTKRIDFIPDNIENGRYSIKMTIQDSNGKLLSEKDNIVFWN